MVAKLSTSRIFSTMLLTEATEAVTVVAAVAVIGIAAALGLAAVPHATPTGWLLRLRQVFGGLCALIAAAGLGAIAAQIRTQSVAQAPFAASEEPRAVEGWVIANDANDNGEPAGSEES